MGWAVVSKANVACGVPVGLLPNSIRLNSKARTVNSDPSISFSSRFINSVFSPSYAASA